MTHESDYRLRIACDLTAIDPARRSAHQALAERLLGESPLAMQELPDGLAFRFTEEHYTAVAEFVAHERLCCPFLRFVLDVAPQRGPVWLRITGSDGAKDILQAVSGH